MPSRATMKPFKIVFLLVCIWVLGFFGFSLAAHAQTIARSDEVLQDLSSQMSLIKWGVGGIVTALCGAIGLLYRTLLETHAKMIILLERESSIRLDMVEKAAINFNNVDNSLDELANKINEFSRRIDSISSSIIQKDK